MRTDEVSVVYAKLDLPDERLAELTGHLSDDERARAERLAFEGDRRCFVAARGLLRELLGQHLDTPPGALRFSYGSRGKPFLEGQTLRFNLSHAHGRAAYAFAVGREVGIDLERIREVERMARIAARVFPTADADAVAAASGEKQAAEFFRAWTRREAYGKATGEGLASGSTPGEGWTLRSLAPPPGFAAALAAAGTDWRLREGPWPAEGDENER